MPAPILPIIPTMSDGRPAPGWGGNKGYGQPTIWQYGNTPQRQQHPGMGDMLSMQQMSPGAGQAQGTSPWLSMDQMGPMQPLDTQNQSFAQPQMGGLGAAPAAKPGWGLLVGAAIAGGLVYLTTRP